MAVQYCTVEDVRSALEERASAYDTPAILRAIDSATGDVDDAARLAPGSFRPTQAAKTFRIPPRRDGGPTRLYLDGLRLYSLTSLTSGGDTVTSSAILQPAEHGAPYHWIDLDGNAFADPVVVTGLWVVGDDRESIGALVTSITSIDAVVTCPDASLVGLGDQLVIDTERLDVVTRAWTPITGGALGAGLTASVADRSVTVADGTKHRTGETILVDSEQMLVTDIASNTLTVLRAQNGSTLATHSNGAAANAKRLLGVTRGVGGSTAAAHTGTTATIYRHVIPGPVRTLAIASAVTTLLAERRGYAPFVGVSGAKIQAEPSLDVLRERVCALYGRPVRVGAV